MKYSRSLYLFFVALIYIVPAFGDSLQNSLVEVSSVYLNQDSPHSIKKVKLTGTGLFFNFPIIDENRFRYFVATSSHLSQGDSPNSLEIWGGEFDSSGRRLPKKEKLTILGRMSDNEHDIEIIEVARPIHIQPYFQYSSRAKLICAPNFRKNDQDYASIDGIKNTKLMIPDFSGKLRSSLSFRVGQSGDEWAYHSVRSMLSSFFGQSIFSSSRLNEILETGEFVIENPAMGGMSGLPILSEIGNQRTGRLMVEGDDLLCVFGFIKGYHRVAPKSYGTEVALAGNLVEDYLERPDLKDTVIWKMRNGLTYRILDREKQVEEISPSYGPSGSILTLDGGSGASVDGGSGASVDGGDTTHILKVIRDDFSNRLEPGLRDGGETVLAYVGGPFALFASPLSREFVKYGSISVPLAPLKFRDSSEALRSLMQNRLQQSSKLFPQEQALWKSHYEALIRQIELETSLSAHEKQLIEDAPEEDREFMTLFAHSERIGSKYPVFSKRPKETLMAETYEPACYVKTPEKPADPIKIKLLISTDFRGTRKYQTLFVDLFGRSVDKNGQSLNSSPLFYPQNISIDDQAESILIDAKGLFFMDFENALGTFYLSDKLGNSIISESQGYYRSLGIDPNAKDEEIFDHLDLSEYSNYRSAKRAEQLARFSMSPIPFLKGLWTKNVENLAMYSQSPLLNYLSQVSHIVVYSKAGYAWPITCVPETE